MMQTKTEGNLFTNTERRLLVLFYSGDVIDTYNILRFALPDITDPEERTAAKCLLSKLLDMDEAVLADIILGSEGSYAG